MSTPGDGVPRSDFHPRKCSLVYQSDGCIQVSLIPRTLNSPLLRNSEVLPGIGAKTDSPNLTPFTDFASLAKSSPQGGMFRPTSTSVPKSPMTSPVKSPGRHDDDVVEEYEPKVDFKPIIDLPDLVEVKTGEEEEEKLFGERAKLYRYDPETNQWKERGIGEMKLLRHRNTKQVRVLMRREQVLKLCANHKLTTAMKLVPMANSDRAWCWTAMDYAEGELKTERLAVRFKNPDQAQLFKQAFEECQEEIQKQEQKAPSSPVKEEKKEKQGTKDQMSLAEMFKPAAGSWECNACYVSNKSDAQKCVACSTRKPGTKPPSVATTKTKAASNQATTGQSLMELFKPEEGSWDCDGCYVNNKANVQKCVACQALKPGLKPSDIKPSSGTTSGGLSGFKFGTAPGGGFTFGTPPAESTTETKTTPSVSKPGAVGKADQITPSVPKPGAVGKADQTKPSVKPEDVKPAASASVSVGPSGFTFGGPATGGFKFGMPPAASTKDTKSTPVASAGEPTSAGFTFGQTTAFSFKKTETATSTSSSSTSANGTGFKFNMASLVSSTTQPSSTTTTSATPSSTTGKTTPGIGSGIAPVTSTTKTTTFGAPQGGFNFSLGKTSTENSPQASTETTSAPAALKFTTPTADTKSSGFSFKTTAEPKTPESKQSAISSGFQFTFTPSGAQGKSPGVTSPKSPEASEYYQNKEGEDDHIHFEPIVSLPDAVPIVTGEENDEVLYEHRAKLYRFDKQEWKERGLGNVKILYNSDTEKCRLLMRREQILKVCCHHYITPDLELKPMPKTDGKALVWFAMDFSDETPGMEHFSIRFKSAEIASKFADAFDTAREKSKDEGAKDSPAANVVKSPETKSTLDPVKPDEVVFVREEKATEEQIAQARKYMLPDHFYLYLSCKPCPGCRGCTDSMPGDSPSQNTGGGSAGSGLFSDLGTGKVFGAASTTKASSPGQVFGTKPTSQTSDGIFNTPTTGGLFGSQPSTKAPSSGGLFGSLPTTTASSTGGLFGSLPTTTASSTGGLFGSLTTTTASSTGGLFGSLTTTTASSTGGLFGSLTTTTASSSGGLFGSLATSTPSSTGGGSLATSTPSSTGGGSLTTTTASSTGGLFGSLATSTPSSTGGGSLATSTPSSTGGLFGSLTTTTSSSTGGLFGSSLPTTSTPSTKGLFGSTPQTSLFGTKPATTVSESASTPQSSADDHTVSPGGTVFGGQTSSAGQFSFSQIASQSGSENAFKKDESKPFSWSGAGKQLFGTKGQGGGAQEGDEDDEVVESHDPHFEPIVALPDLVEIKTGEEDFDALFSIRAKLYRFDKDINQWKEKGVGEMKILEQHQTGKIRLLLRREQIYKLACNHWLTPDLSFKPMATSETAWCWTTQDYSEEEPRMEQLAVKFKNQEIATQFKELIDKCQAKLREMPQSTHEDKMPIQVSEVTSEASDAVISQPTEEDDEEEEEEDDEDEDDDDDDDDEMILFEKRATLYTKDGTWKILGMGQLKVLYDEDVNGNRIAMETDDKETVCNHLLTKESVLKINKKQRNCEWSPIDFSTDDPVRREFRAQFSSETVLDEFERFFKQGQTLAVDSDLSERHMMTTYPREIVYPEVHAHSAGTED
ncbi:E3 SUMO-protein ligase RanBP2-like isoform X2 [Pecten maximus]|uniref:E3 SUMO-protein ligase RanBP2-like isoform X2 n=1 Tax=Pecten maximus TaxID=6579 RepID=UPI001458A896|nr:E3 SUMO-protein ligase RanBP2-like isoform X2 [Pecten maximus]